MIQKIKLNCTCTTKVWVGGWKLWSIFHEEKLELVKHKLRWACRSAAVIRCIYLFCQLSVQTHLHQYKPRFTAGKFLEHFRQISHRRTREFWLPYQVVREACNGCFDRFQANSFTWEFDLKWLSTKSWSCLSTAIRYLCRQERDKGLTQQITEYDKDLWKDRTIQSISELIHSRNFETILLRNLRQ